MSSAAPLGTKHGAGLGAVAGLLLLACCQQHGAVDAGRTPDATRPPDAPDAWEWSCSIAQMPPAPGDTPQVTVVYDKAMTGNVGDDDGAVASFAGDGDSVVVFTPRTTHVVSPTGVTSTLYAQGTDPEVFLLDVVEGASSFGAVMVQQWQTPRPPDTVFCVLDSSGGYDPSRCLLLGTALFSSIPRVTYDGSNYRAYLAVSNGGLRRWIIDATPTALAEEDLWDAASFGDRDVWGAASDGSEDLVAIGGWDPADPRCGTVKVHRWTAADHTVTNLLPPDLGGGGPYIGRVADGVGLFGYAYCVDVADPSGECKLLSQSQRVMLMGTYRLGGPTPMLHAVAMPDSIATVFHDGESTVIADQPALHELQLSRFGPDDTPELQNVVLPLAYHGTTVELEGIFAGTALGPGDYFVVYETNAPERRAARFRIE